MGWAFIQTLLRSSYDMYGFHSLETDVEDLRLLIDHIQRTFSKDVPIVLMGHSTGCQVNNEHVAAFNDVKMSSITPFQISILQLY